MPLVCTALHSAWLNSTGHGFWLELQIVVTNEYMVIISIGFFIIDPNEITKLNLMNSATC